ncbi:DUF1062 domain-containing protein [Proteiniborus sp. MB09-C3]|uniref:DUF1062 domain-containing protein n=1 Tax=Proteiniborus sp. MB09-C3 TaxID=3050072 RepID=UPI002557025E|nr:DUF1062 domain-containing protein [Proteiniborus sp. MB09-C3]WIV13518.1 DUF1062 domain-containing protein [Proteiniborus sp. MB09-C3]
MSYLNTIEWEIVPETIPEVKRNCPKCGEKKNYISSEKFRVNANGPLIDIWLIYQCKKCKSTWNMAIHERTNIKEISKDKYEKFLSNDKELAMEYGFDMNIHNKNRTEIIWDSVKYHIISKELNRAGKMENEQQYIIRCKYQLPIRVDRLLCEKLCISRSKVKDLYEKGAIYSQENSNILKLKIFDGMLICINNKYFE